MVSELRRDTCHEVEKASKLKAQSSGMTKASVGRAKEIRCVAYYMDIWK